MALELKARLKRANGWRRLWFVLSVLGIFYAMFLQSFIFTQASSLNRHGYVWSIENDIRNPLCKHYIFDPFESLVKPESGLVCNNLYQYRANSENRDQSVSLEFFKMEEFKWWWTYLGQSFLLFGTLAIVLSALVYFAGFLFAWVVAGFRKAAD